MVTSVISDAKKAKGRPRFEPSRNPRKQPERQRVTKEILKCSHCLPQIEKSAQENHNRKMNCSV